MAIKHFDWAPNDKPVATLIDRFWSDEDEVKWHGPDTKTFEDYALENILYVRINLDWGKPYGGLAGFKVKIEEETGSGWTQQFFETITCDLQNPSRRCIPRAIFGTWKKGSLLSMFYQKDLIFKFRISVSIRGKGAMDTGSGGYEVNWSDFKTREFTAIFKPPKIQVAVQELSELEKFTKNYFQEFKKKFKVE